MKEWDGIVHYHKNMSQAERMETPKTETSNIPGAAEIRSMQREHAERLNQRKVQLLDQFAAACMLESGTLPSEMELVQQDRGKEMVLFFRKRTGGEVKGEE